MLKLKKAAALLLSVMLLLSALTFTASAVNEQNKAQISVSVSNSDPAKGETVTVTVAIDNYKTMSPRISAMYLSVSFDTAYFEYVTGSEESVLTVNKGDITSVGYDGDDTVSYAYVYANSKQSTLPTTAIEIFKFKLRVRNSVSEAVDTLISVDEMELYNGKIATEYSDIVCKDPINGALTVWPERPPILFNGEPENLGTYEGDVTLRFDSSNATVSYEGRDAVPVTSPYVCSKNGSYTVTVTTASGTTTETFKVSKEISHISVKPGTFRTEYAVGVQPDYSNGVIIVTYKDGTYNELSMADEDVSVSGFDPGKTGRQTLAIKYRGKTTSISVTVTSKSVTSFIISSPITKTEYLTGQEIDVTGGMLTVRYDDGTEENVALGASMLLGYDKTYVGEQIITVKYGELTQAFKVNYIARDTVDKLISDIDAIVLSELTAADRSAISSLAERYNALSDLEKNAITNFTKLNDAISIINSLSQESTETEPDASESEESTAPEQSTSKDDIGGDPFTDLKTIWIVVAIIVGLSVIAGVVYFLFIYFKRQKELDDDYYDDDMADDDDDDDLSYDEELLQLDDDDDDENEKEEE